MLTFASSHFDYITARRNGAVYVRRNYSVADHPDDLRSKVYLLKHFERFIMDRLYGDHEYVYEDLERTKGMDFVQKYLRMKHVIVFKLSHEVLQFNFHDHSKVVLSHSGRRVTYIDRNYVMFRHSLAELCAVSLRPPHPDPERAKYYQRLTEKVKYCKEVLVSIRAAASTMENGSSEAASVETHLQAGLAASAALSVAPSLASRSSKGSLR